MRQRLRPAYSSQELSDIYAVPHAHDVWEDHRLRVKMTIAFASWFNVQSVADLSAGDATIINAIEAQAKFIGDYAPRYEFTGALEQTIDLIPNVDLFICSETIEHLDDPDLALRKIRARTKHLVLTTPIGENNNGNPQHYWGWDTDDMKTMLEAAGFEPVIHTVLNFRQPHFIYD